jgi:hypothetical protein
VQCLACGGGEVIEAIAGIQNLKPFSSHMLESVPALDMTKIRQLKNLYWNAFKHLTTRSGEQRDDADTLAAFDDSKNDAALFIGWHDYFAVTGRLPLPVQVFQLWWFSLNEEKLALGADLDTIRGLFPDIVKVGRAEQKRRLRRTVEKYRDHVETLADAQTENNPLCFPASVFESCT